MSLSNRAFQPNRLLAKVRPATVFAVIILTALLAFEIFNYSTTEYALSDLLGGMSFIGLSWSTILSIAFCGIDFAGIARLFTPERGADEPKEVWYLFGAWLLAATMNAVLTWWGVSMAVASHSMESSAVVDPNTLTKAVPVFVALMVWVIRILVIGTISVAGERFLWGEARRGRSAGLSTNAPVVPGAGYSPRPTTAPRTIMPRPVASAAPKEMSAAGHAEPTYHSMTMSARPAPRPGVDTSNSSRKL